MVASSKDKIAQTMFSVKVHTEGEDNLVAVCDKEILGKTFSQGDLEFRVKESFYGGDILDLAETLELISKASNVNLVGNRIVDEILSKGLLNQECILEVAGVKHAQIVELS
ncbi:DUF424 domain-containing protein [Candidatus Altiarchaeota archaeon]